MVQTTSRCPPSGWGRCRPFDDVASVDVQACSGSNMSGIRSSASRHPRWHRGQRQCWQDLGQLAAANMSAMYMHVHGSLHCKSGASSDSLCRLLDFTAVLHSGIAHSIAHSGIAHSLFSSASVECLCWVVVVCRVHVCDSAFSRVVLFCLATQCFRGLLCFAARLSVFVVGRRARPRFRAVLRSDRAIASGLLCPTDEFAGQFCFSC